jgi:hypothetical protein
MTVGGSQQQRLFRRAIRDGATMLTACAKSGFSVSEARLVLAEDAKNPPPPEAFELLHLEETITPAPTGAQPAKEDDMARPKKEPQVEAIGTPDYALAVRIWRQDIKPAISKVGEFAQEQSTAYKAIKKDANIQPQAAKLAFKLDGMEEAKRDDFLRSLNGLLKALNIFMPADMVDIAEGKGTTTDSVIPIGGKATRRSGLATIPAGPPGDTDLAGEDDEAPASDHHHAEAAE